MSHFSVLVLTDEKPNEDSIGKILQPWHEFECTGIDDEYVVDVDITEKALKQFNEATVTVLRAPDGTLHDRFTEAGAWKPEFSCTGSYGQREEYVPAGYEKVEVPAHERESAAKWIASYYGLALAGSSDGNDAKYGFVEVGADGEVIRAIDRTNPNKKWDWWVIGGRWSGLLRVKGSTVADIAMKRDVDVATMRAEARESAATLWDKANAAVNGLAAVEDFKVFEERFPGDWDAIRNAYWEQPALVALKAAFPGSFFLRNEIEAIQHDRAAYLQSAEDGALSTFAVVKDGQWYERGEMGWFACVSNEKDTGEWNREFAKLIDALPETSFLTVVDCHI